MLWFILAFMLGAVTAVGVIYLGLFGFMFR